MGKGKGKLWWLFIDVVKWWIMVLLLVLFKRVLSNMFDRGFVFVYYFFLGIEVVRRVVGVLLGIMYIDEEYCKDLNFLILFF